MTKSIKHKLSFIPKFRYLMHSIREYKKYAFGSIIFVLLETILECVIPYIMSLLIEVLSSFINVTVTDALKEQALHSVLIYAVILLVLGALSLVCGITAGRMSAIAATGLTKNLRVDIFKEGARCGITFTRYVPKDNVIVPETMDDYNITKIKTYETTKTSNPIKFGLEKIIKLGNNAPYNNMFKEVVIKGRRKVVN